MTIAVSAGVMRILVLLFVTALAGTAFADPGKLAEVHFAAGSANVGANAAAIDDVAGWANAHPGAMIVLDGHAANNPRLSLERAKSVQAELIAAGVSPHQIVIATFTAGDGESVIVWGTRDKMRAIELTER